jgi:folate-binding protein YgfZ
MTPIENAYCRAQESRYAWLPERSVLELRGREARSFLNALVTNNVSKATGERAIYAALLSPQGRYLHDFFIAQGERPDALWLDAERAGLGELKRRLETYRLRAEVKIEERTDLVVAALFGPDALAKLDLTPEPGFARPFKGGVILVDPRLKALGARAILPGGSAEAALSEAGLAPAGAEAYDNLRLALGVPDGSRDLEPNEALPLEGNLDLLHAIDFEKGCFIGQELTARMKRRHLVRRRLFAVEADGAVPPPGTPVLASGREIGVLRSGRERQALAVLRLEEVKAAQAGDAPIEAGAVRLRPRTPDLDGAEF